MKAKDPFTGICARNSIMYEGEREKEKRKIGKERKRKKRGRERKGECGL